MFAGACCPILRSTTKSPREKRTGAFWGRYLSIMNEEREIVIVGSGPAGYTAGIYAGRAGLEPLIVAGSVTAGGALVNTTDVENFPGFPDGVMGPDLMDSMERQAVRHGSEIRYDDAVSLTLTGEPEDWASSEDRYSKEVVLSEGETVRAKAVILAMGAEHRRLGVPGEDRLSGHGVSWCATCDGAFFRGKKVMVVGGGDSAMEEASFLSRFASSVEVVHRRDSFRASRAMVDRVRSLGNVSIRWNSKITEFVGDSTLAGVRLEDTETGDSGFSEVDGVFVAVGHDPRSALVHGQVGVDRDGYVLTLENHTHAMSGSSMLDSVIPGVFACGDLVDRTYRQAITAAGSGCAAALDAQHFLDSNGI